MKREMSHSSVGSRKSYAAKGTPRRTQSGMSLGHAELSSFAITSGRLQTLEEASRMVDVSAYLLQAGSDAGLLPNGLSLLNTTGVQDLAAYSPQLSASLGQHMDPNHMQFEYPQIGSPAASSSFHASSRLSTPSSEPFHTAGFPDTPLESLNSSPVMGVHSPGYVFLHLSHHSRTAEAHSLGNSQVLEVGHMLPGEGFNMTPNPDSSEGYQLPASFTNRRPSADGESARDHALYKNAVPSEDGLFHCPFEGRADCSHKPEKLKCNYE